MPRGNNKGGLMACMEHFCYECGHTAFNNGYMLACPKCKSSNVQSFWDEQNDGDYDDDDDSGD